MRIELSWKDPDGSQKSFQTGCPKLAESMLRSSADFPQVTDGIKESFRARYGSVLGSFERLLREQMEGQPRDVIDVQIPGLDVRIRENKGVESCN